MLSGAISSAPRWSVVGLTGNATAVSRAISSRPPPDAAAERIETTNTETYAEGSSSRTSPRLNGSSAMYAGTVETSTVISSSTPTTTGAARRERPRRVAARKRSRCPTSATARRISWLVQEGSVDAGTLLTAHLGGGHRGDRGAAAQHDRLLAGLHRELTEVGRDDHGRAARAGVGDDVHGGLDPERVDAV